MDKNETYKLLDCELRNLQMTLLDILIEINRICIKYDIYYVLMMGTMLGAVRHGGFIPWDDDLDIGMLRPEYEKFKKACKIELDKSKYFYQDQETDPYYLWGYARIRNINSIYVRSGQEHLKMKTGIFVDIFPFDSVPDNKLIAHIHCFYCFVLRKFLYSNVGYKTSKKKYLRLLYNIMKLVPITCTHKRIKNLTKVKKETKFVRIITFPNPKGQLGYLHKWMKEWKYIDFEGYKFPGTKDYDELLKFLYGDYMKLPPVEKRTNTHPASAFRLPKDR